MKNPDRKTVSKLEALPNIGKAIAEDLKMIGIDHPGKLIGKDPYKLHEKLCRKTGHWHDLCVLDTFMSAIRFMEGGGPLPWYAFTEERKKHLQGKTLNYP